MFTGAHEKTSLFNKVFGRKKKGLKSDVETVKDDKEYSTFSAQFPPPEWAWYEKQIPPTSKAPISRAQTWHHRMVPPRFVSDASVQSDFDEDVNLHAHTLPANLQGPPFRLPTRSSSSHSHDSQSSNRELPPEESAREVNDTRRLNRRRNDPKVSRSKSARRRGEKERRASHRQSVQVAPPLPQDECGSHKSQTESNIYCEPEMFAPPDGLTSTPYDGHDIQRNVLNNVVVGEQDSVPSPHLRRRNFQEIRCPPFCSNDISIEYHGKLPKKGTLYSVSRDSGVNCVGLVDSKSGGSHSQPQRAPGVVNVLNNNTGINSKHGQFQHHNYENNLVSHQAMVHVPELTSPQQQDSGFSSPRSDPDNASNLYHQITSVDQCNSDSSNIKNNQTAKENPAKHQHRAANDTAVYENMNTIEKYPNKSMESLTITGSEIYPSYKPHVLLQTDKDGSLTPSSSCSSKQTVLERFPQVNGHQVSPRKAQPTRDGYLVKNEPFMELQVSSDCPYHGDGTQGQVQSRSHERSPRKPRHREGSHGARGQCPVHSHPGDRPSNRNDSVRRSLTGKMVSAMADNHHTHQRASQKGHDPRLAFLGDVEVVGIV